MITQQTKDVLAGKYGKTTDPVNPELQKKALGDEKPITHRPADDLEPGLPKFEKEVAPYKKQDEDTLSYALFPQVATEYFKYRDAQETGIDATKGDKETKSYPA